MDVCRWHHDPSVPDGRFLVPGCWNRVLYGDYADCHCPPAPKRLPRAALALLDGLVALALDDDQLHEAWLYLARTNSR